MGDVLVDTSAWILAVHRKDPRARQRLKVIVTEATAATCPMVLLEMLVGRPRGENSLATRNRFSALNWLPCTDEVWDKAWSLASEARFRGHTLPGADALIAAHAISARAVLLHADSDFVRIAKWSGLEHESLLGA